MTTVKDVANLAGVSVGTVSNVLNGKTNNRKLVRQVEDAMNKLDYYPDVRARNLKKTDNSLVGVIIPDLQDPACVSFLSEVDKTLRASNFDVFLKISQNNYQLERKCVSQCLAHHVNGILIYSPFKNNVSSLLKNTNIPVALVGDRNSNHFDGDTTIISYDTALKKSLAYLYSHKIKKAGLITQSNLSDENYLYTIYKHNYPDYNDNYVKITDSSQESGFISAFTLLTDYPEIEALIISDYQLAKGAIKALQTLDIKKVHLIVIKENNWIEDSEEIDAQLSISFEKIGNDITRRLIHAMSNPKIHEYINKTFEAEFTTNNLDSLDLSKKKKTLHFELVDSLASRALVMYSKIYTHKTGTKVEFTLKNYNQLEHDLYDQKAKKDTHYDGFSVDIAWMDGFADQGILLPLNNLYQNIPNYFTDFMPGMLQEYGIRNNKLLGLPFISGTQLLFYQKDLFEDKMIRYNYRLTNNEPLLPPKNWAQFNLIAKFFTRKYNPRSPVKYGQSGIYGRNISTSISFLNRLWAYGSDVFDDSGNIIINNKNALAALKNFKEGYKYTTQKKSIDTWEKVAQEFSTGDVAMSVLYNADAVNINDFSKSKVAGNIGFKIIPGESPVLGGWCLSINPFSNNVAAAIDFIIWVCSSNNAVPFSLLGGSTLRNEFYSHSDLDTVYPWKSLLKESFPISRKRILPTSIKDYEQGDKIYTSIISEELTRVLDDEIDEQAALINMSTKLKSFINTHKK